MIRSVYPKREKFMIIRVQFFSYRGKSEQTWDVGKKTF